MRRWFWFLLGVLVVLGLWSWARAQGVPRLPGPAVGPLAAPLPVVRQHPLLQGLVDWFRVAEPWAAGPRWYSLGSVRTGTLTGMGAGFGWRRTARTNASGEMGFDGVGSFIDLGQSPALDLSGPLTFFCWIRPDVVDYSATNGAALVGAGNATTPGRPYELLIGRLAVGNVRLRWGDTDIVDSGADVLAIGVPAYIAAVREGGTGAWTGRIYINSVEVVNTATSTNPLAMDGTSTFSLGRRFASAAYYQGAMDDMMLWNRALSPAEIGAAVVLARQGWPGVLRRQTDLVAQGAPAAAVVSGGGKGRFFPFLWPEQRK